jgi:flavodoxin
MAMTCTMQAPLQPPHLPLNILIAYFSYTGGTKRIAEALSETLRASYNVETVEISPTRKRSYLHWLAYSFIPNSEVNIENAEMDLSGYDGVLLGFPKWTLSCPPLNRFIRTLTNVRKPKFYLFMTCGGFDEHRYLDSLARKLAKMGCNVAETLTVRRESIQRETYAGHIEALVERLSVQLEQEWLP